MNYILKAAVIALQIDSVNGSTVYFTDGSTLDVDNEFITNQVPGSGDYVIDGSKVMERGKFEAMYMEPVVADEGEVIDSLRQDLSVASDLLDESAQEIERLKTQLAEVADSAPLDVTQAGGSEGSDPVDPSAPEGGDIPEGTAAGDIPEGTAAGDEPALS